MQYDSKRLNRPPTLSEYATAKKKFEVDLDRNPDCGNPNCKECYKEIHVGIDPGSEEGDQTCVLIVDRETLLRMYWSGIPDDKKKKIKIGENHDTKFNKIRP
jgi:hypothetical protein